MITMNKEHYMRKAIELAREAALLGEIPVGCVIIDESGSIIGKGRNTRETSRCVLGHAELNAISEACEHLSDWRLEGCTIFITLEPCPMCAGAIINARIPCVVYGAKEENFGACGSVLNLFSERFGHHPAIYGGVLEAECKALMTDFFKEIRA